MSRIKDNVEDTLDFDPTLRKVWEDGQGPEIWAEQTTPKESLVCKNGHPAQVKDLVSMSHLLEAPVRVVESHRSKSVKLPVGMFFKDILWEEAVCMFTRDNFYNLKLVVVSSVPINIPYELVHQPMSPVEFEKEKRSAYDYRSGRLGFNPKDFEDDTWFESWCSDTLLRDKEGQIYRCGTTASCYYEGMEMLPTGGAFQRYEHGKERFAVEVNSTNVKLLRIMEAVIDSATDFVVNRRKDEQELEALQRFESERRTDEYSLKRALEARQWLKSRGVEYESLR